MRDKIANLKRLPVDGLLNFRDLGGYAAGEQGATKWRTIYRCDGLFALSDNAINRILNYCNPSVVIDLRSTGEQVLRPNVFAYSDKVEFVSIPVINETLKPEAIEKDWKKLDTGYKAVLKYSKSQIYSIITKIADNLPNPVIYNCTAGKDRTGIVTALILAVCGVDYFDIICDYEVSATYIRKDLNKVTEPGKVLEEEFIESPAKIMKELLLDIDSMYGSVYEYLLSCGVSKSSLDRIKLHFVDEIGW